ncbi:MAG: putative 26S proteasome regulatory subunit [Alyxoria varia]|nr:MAG: putative 26S proteasome regulatory subunit [Alyxoria varia]
MGLPVRSLHDPSVESSNTLQADGDKGKQQNKTLQELVAEKDQVESELKALGQVLDSHGVNMNTGLTTFDGFPRADIDVPQIRTTRARIIRLRNDYKSLMGQIEKGLEAHFANGAANSPNVASTTSTSSSQQSVAPRSVSAGTPTENPFAKVNSVEPGSPAHQAGMRTGDRIQNFGDADWLNNDKLRKVAEIVGQSEGRQIAVSVLRNGDGADTSQWATHQLTLTPTRTWGGRGLLGCHLVPE